MTVKAFRSRLRRRPFVPFRTILATGTTYETPTREALVSFLHVGANEDLPWPSAKAS